MFLLTFVNILENTSHKQNLIKKSLIFKKPLEGVVSQVAAVRPEDIPTDIKQTFHRCRRSLDGQEPCS